jgi:hypothetical protein
MDGAAAAIAHERYQNSFKEGEKPIKPLIISGAASN